MAIVISQSRKGGTVGIKNLGNTCYVGSTVQIFFMCCPLLRDFLTERCYVLNVGSLHRGSIINATAALMRRLASSKTSVSIEDFLVSSECWHLLLVLLFQYFCIVRLFSLQAVVEKNWSEFKKREQLDSFDFLVFLLGGLHEDVKVSWWHSNRFPHACCKLLQFFKNK